MPVRSTRLRPAAAPRPNKAPGFSQQAPGLVSRPAVGTSVRPFQAQHEARLTRLAVLCVWQRVVVMGKRKGVVRFFGPTSYGPGARSPPHFYTVALARVAQTASVFATAERAARFCSLFQCGALRSAHDLDLPILWGQATGLGWSSISPADRTTAAPTATATSHVRLPTRFPARACTCVVLLSSCTPARCDGQS
jgi:hypothetical protein